MDHFEAVMGAYVGQRKIARNKYDAPLTSLLGECSLARLLGTSPSVSILVAMVSTKFREDNHFFPILSNQILLIQNDPNVFLNMSPIKFSNKKTRIGTKYISYT